MPCERGAGSGTVRGRDHRCSGGNASARTGTIGVLSVRKKYGARNVKLRNSCVLVGADTDLSCATLRAASASLGGVAGAVPPPHAASSTGKTAVHANNGLLGTRHMAASGAVGGDAARLVPGCARAGWNERWGGGATPASHRKQVVRALPLLFPLRRTRRCHPERARGTRASEGPAVTQSARGVQSPRGPRPSEGLAVLRPVHRRPGPSHLRESGSFAPAALRMTSRSLPGG